MFLNEKLEKIAQLNSAIFNGQGVVQVVDIQMTNTVSTNKPINAKNVAKIYEIKLSDDKIEKLRDIEYPDAVEKALFNMNYDKIEENDESLTFKISSLSINLYDMAGRCLEDSQIPRSTTFKLQKVETYENNKYVLDLESTVMLSMNNEMLKQYNSITGLINRHFSQKLEISENTERILIVFPNTPSIPLIYSYNNTTFDLNNLIGLENSDYQFTSFGQNFIFKDQVVTETDSTSIVLDSGFHKANSVIKLMKDEFIKEEPANTIDKSKYIYDYHNIYGFFYKDGSKAEYHLKGKNVDYLLYSTDKRYNANQLDLFNIIDERVKHNSQDTKIYEKGKIMFDNVFGSSNNLILSNFIAFINIDKNLYIFEDLCNVNTYHYYLYDGCKNLDKVITIYNEEYVLIREFNLCNEEGVIACSINLLSIDENKSINTILFSMTKYDEKRNKKYLLYKSTINGNYVVNGYIEESDTDHHEQNDLIRSFDYHAPDLENYHQNTRYIGEDVNADIITKFDSLFYTKSQFDDIIIRNYLGLPVNPRYIKI